MAIKKRSEMDPEVDGEIFGVMAGDYSHPHAKKKITPKRKSATPKKIASLRVPLVKLNPSDYLLPENIRIDKDAVHEVSPKTLRILESRVNSMTRGLSNLLLATAIPTMVAVEKAVSYTQSVVLDVFGYETDQDPTIPEMLGDLTRLDVALFFVSKMRASEQQKELISKGLIEQHVVLVTETIRRAEKQKGFTARMDQMRSVVMARGSKKQEQEDPSGSDVTARRASKRSRK